MKNLWTLSAILLLIGFCVFVYSSVPQTVKQPYTKWDTQTKDNVLEDGTISSTSIFFSKSYSFKSGDKILITASIDEGTLSVRVYEAWTSNEIAFRDDVQSVNLDVTIPNDGYYTISVNRYKRSVGIIYLTKVNADVRVTTRTTEQALVQTYRDTTTYPNKNFESAGIVLLLTGIGVGVLSFQKKDHEHKD